jgi:cytochrome c556
LLIYLEVQLMRVLLGGLISVLLLWQSTALLAHEDVENPETRFRHESMKAARSHLKAIGLMQDNLLEFKGQLRVQASALQLFFVALPDLFPKEGDYAESDASPEIWKKWEEFNAYARDGAKAAEEMSFFRDPLSEEAMGAFDRVRRACKGCHDKFRE